MTRRCVLAATMAVLLTVHPVSAAEPGSHPGIAYSLVGRNGSGFNAMAKAGIARFEKDTRQTVIEAEAGIGGDAGVSEAASLDRLMAQGADPIIAVGFNFADALAVLALAHPDRAFAIIDARIDLPNVASIEFREQEGAYLGGMLAALHSRSAVLGFVGAVDIPPIRRFACGFRRGARSVNPAIVINSEILAEGRKGFSDPGAGRAAASRLLDGGADVLFSAAGATGAGVIAAAKERDRLVIDIDANRDGGKSGVVLTSIVKRVDTVVYQLLHDAYDQSWQPGRRSVGLTENAMDWVLDKNNVMLISMAEQDRVTKAAFDLASGTATLAADDRGAGCD